MNKQVIDNLLSLCVQQMMVTTNDKKVTSVRVFIIHFASQKKKQKTLNTVNYIRQHRSEKNDTL